MKRLLLFLSLCSVTSVHSVPVETLEPIMPQYQLLAQKDALESLVKNVWEKCLNSLNFQFPGLAQKNPSDERIMSVNWEFEKQAKITSDNFDLIRAIESYVGAAFYQFPTSLIKFDQPEQADVLKEVLGRM